MLRVRKADYGKKKGKPVVNVPLISCVQPLLYFYMHTVCQHMKICRLCISVHVSFLYDSISARNSKHISHLLERREMADVCKQHYFFCCLYLSYEIEVSGNIWGPLGFST